MTHIRVLHINCSRSCCPREPPLAPTHIGPPAAKFKGCHGLCPFTQELAAAHSGFQPGQPRLLATRSTHPGIPRVPKHSRVLQGIVPPEAECAMPCSSRSTQSEPVMKNLKGAVSVLQGLPPPVAEAQVLCTLRLAGDAGVNLLSMYS